MNELTKAEEQVMQILWKRKKAFVRDIVNEFIDKKPAYNTISTVIRILETKGFVSHIAYGKTHEYYPLIEKKEYSKKFLRKFIGNYFNNSFQRMVSFFSKEEDLSIEELEKVKQMLDDEINKKKMQKNNDNGHC